MTGRTGAGYSADPQRKPSRIRADHVTCRLSVARAAGRSRGRPSQQSVEAQLERTRRRTGPGRCRRGHKKLFVPDFELSLPWPHPSPVDSGGERGSDKNRPGSGHAREVISWVYLPPTYGLISCVRCALSNLLGKLHMPDQ